MATATHRMIVDHKIINVGDDVPDLGSLRFTKGGYGERAEIEGNSADVSKLPTDVLQGSAAYMVDTAGLYMYDETNEEWVQQ